MKHGFWISTVVITLLLFPGLMTAQEAAPVAEEVATGITTGDPTVDVGELELLLKPLTKADLEAEIKAWLDLVKSKVREVSNAEILAGRAEGEEKKNLLEQKIAIQGERTGLIDRFKVVMEALRDKGGDVAEYEQYIDAVSGLGLGAEVGKMDASATWITIKTWLKDKDGGIRYGKNLLFFLVTLFAFWILAGILSRIVNRALSAMKKTSDLLRTFLVNSIRRVTIIVGLVVALSMLEIDIGPLVAAIGVMGFVIGFALQDTLGNFASGVMLLMYRPYDVGDVIDAAGVTGTVVKMSLVSTTIKSFDNQKVVVPNSSIWGNVITNITGNDTRRVDMVFGIGYADDIAKTQGILEEIVNNHSLALKDPAPVVKLHELADSSVNFICRPWCKTSDYWNVYWDVTRAVKERFDKEGVSIPFPQRDVHLYKESADA
jgi:small conductance mechanosensitive channel